MKGSLPRPAPSGLPSAENRWTKAAAAAQGPARLAIVGAAAIDIVSRPGGPNAHTTAPGTVAFTPGGVSRNVYEAAFKCGVEDAVLVAPVGREEQDPLAHLLRQGLAGFGGREDGLVVMPGRTPTVNMMLDEAGDLLAGVADMSSAEAMTGQQVGHFCLIVWEDKRPYLFKRLPTAWKSSSRRLLLSMATLPSRRSAIFCGIAV